MSAANSDRNLLFGILAMQMDFIRREALIKAMNDWAIAKKTSLAEILVANNDLSSRHRDLLEQMVDAHVELHQRDPEKSLASLRASDFVRESLSQLDATELVEAMTHLTLATSAGNADATIARAGNCDPANQKSSPHDRFRIIRLHAVGGLGKVSVAMDRELNREVALKEIKEEYAFDESARSRFTLEAEITGGLEHPGIVPVYGLGQRDDGQPYYAMRFIKGDSLKVACATYHDTKAGRNDQDNALEFRKLMGRFIDVCNAIEYAHSRGVLHRDLKPGNIMLGKYGETLVVDWGLAKSIGRDFDSKNLDEHTLQPGVSGSTPATQVGSAIGTPQFMSPEQAAGKLDELGKPCDVYSLGATLYFLLVNKPPVTDRNLEVVLAKVKAGDIEPPRVVDPSIPKSLSAICMKAMSVAPHDRYQSARALADDVERWLADEPVLAHSDSWTEQLTRWTRKHRMLTGSAAASLLAIALVSIAAAVLIDDARRAKVVALGETTKALSSATLAREEADRERIRANANFAAARRAVDEYYTEISESTLLRRQESDDLRELRRTLLEHALQYYEAFAEQAGADESFRGELADAYSRAALIRGEIGNSERALEAADQALEIRRELLSKEPDSIKQMDELAKVLSLVAMFRRNTGRVDEVIEPAFEAVALTRRLVDAEPHDSMHRQELASRLNALAVFYNDQGLRNDANSALEQAIDLYEALIEEHSDDPSLRDRLAGLWLNQGQWKTDAGEVQAGIRLLEQAHAVFAELSEKDPTNSESTLALASIDLNLGAAYRRLDDFERSLEYSQSGKSRFQSLAQAHPTVLLYRSSLAKSLDNIGDVLSILGRDAEALLTYEQARALFVDLHRDNPSVMEYRRDVANNGDLIGHALLKLGRDADALRSFEQSRDVFVPLVDDIPINSGYRSALLHVLKHLSALYQQQDQPVEAIEALRESVAQLRVLRAQLSNNVQFEKQLIMSSAELADTLRHNGPLADAVLEYATLIDMLEKPSSAFSESELQSLRANVLNNLGAVFNDLDRYQEGLDAYRKAIALNDQLHRANPDNLFFTEALATSRYNEANALRDMDRPADALTSFRAAIELLKQIVDQDSNQILALGLLGASLNNLGNVLSDLNQLDEAEMALRSAIEYQTKAVEADPENPRYRTYLRNHQGSLAEVIAKKEKRDQQ